MILFLDFDGVLHGLGQPKFEHLPRFEAILRDFPRVEVVISSSWREQFPLGEIRGFFSEDVQPRIIGTTPAITAKWPPYPAHVRHDEICQYRLQQKMQERPWIILDDDARLFPKDCPELVLFDPAKGLNGEMDVILRRRLT